MATIPQISPVIRCYIQDFTTQVTRTYSNPGGFYDGGAYEFTVTLVVYPFTTFDQINFQFDARNISVGQWLLQSTGLAYLITNINEPTVDNVTISVTIRDVDLYNLYSDYTAQGINFPGEGTITDNIIFSLSEEGTPIITYTTLQSIAGSTIWLNDALGRFAYRNFIKNFYNFDINNKTIDAYSNYSVGQLVYIGLDSNSGSNCFLPIDPRNEEHVDKVFGRVSSVNQPEMGNIYVQPFGKVITSFPFDLPGNPGDVLYYDGSNSDGVSYTSTVKPADHPIPMYIKITDKVASVLYGSVCSANNSTGSGSGSGSGYISGPYIIKLISLDINRVSDVIEDARDPDGNSLMTNSNWSIVCDGASTVTVTFSNVLSNGQFTNFRKMAVINSNIPVTYVTGAISGAGSFAANVRYIPSDSKLIFGNITGAQYGYTTSNCAVYILFDLNASPNFNLF